MSAATITTHGVIEAGGSYNLHAKIPAGGGNLALPYLEKTARSCTLRSGSDPIVIADYGSSQGRNSLAPMRAAILWVLALIGRARIATLLSHSSMRLCSPQFAAVLIASLGPYRFRPRLVENQTIVPASIREKDWAGELARARRTFLL